MMIKKVVLLFGIFLYFTSAWGQIQIQEMKKVMAKPIPKYDSSENFKFQGNMNDYSMYVGKDIVFLPKNKNFDSYKEEKEESFCFSEIEEDGTLSGISVPTEDVYGKIYRIVEFKTAPTNGSFLYTTTRRSEDGYLVLNDLQDTTRTYIYRITLEAHFDIWQARGYPFLIISYLNKVKEENVGNYFVIKKGSNEKEYDDNFDDINSGLPIEIKAQEKFQCVDLKIMDAPRDCEYMQPFLIFQNSKGNQIRVGFNSYVAMPSYKFYKPTICSLGNNFVSQKDIQQKQQQRKAYRANCIKLYGEYYGPLVAESKVEIGMSQKLCEAAWGKPHHINKTVSENGTREQWVYHGGYLYIENGKLVSIQVTE